MKERDFFIDVLKGWGIILVIWGHSSNSYLTKYILFICLYSFFCRDVFLIGR